MYSPAFLSLRTTSGSPPVLSISLSDHSFSVFASSFACTLAHSRPLWRVMFFSKRAFNALSSSSRCSDDNSFLPALMFFILLIISDRAPEYLTDIRQIYEQFPFEVMVCDCAFTAAQLVRRKLNVMCTSPMAAMVVCC